MLVHTSYTFGFSIIISMLSSLYIYLFTTEQLVVSETELGERVLRGEKQVFLSLPAAPSSRKRKPLTDEQLQERRRKVGYHNTGACNIVSLVELLLNPKINYLGFF